MTERNRERGIGGIDLAGGSQMLAHSGDVSAREAIIGFGGQLLGVGARAIGLGVG